MIEGRPLSYYSPGGVSWLPLTTPSAFWRNLEGLALCEVKFHRCWEYLDTFALYHCRALLVPGPGPKDSCCGGRLPLDTPCTRRDTEARSLSWQRQILSQIPNATNQPFSLEYLPSLSSCPFKPIDQIKISTTTASEFWASVSDHHLLLSASRISPSHLNSSCRSRFTKMSSDWLTSWVCCFLALANLHLPPFRCHLWAQI